MTGSRIIPCPIPSEQARDVRARALNFVLFCHEKRGRLPKSGPDDAMKGSSDDNRATASIQPGPDGTSPGAPGRFPPVGHRGGERSRAMR